VAACAAERGNLIQGEQEIASAVKLRRVAILVVCRMLPVHNIG